MSRYRGVHLWFFGIFGIDLTAYREPDDRSVQLRTTPKLPAPNTSPTLYLSRKFLG